jgi:hypothetical protein
MTDGVNPFRLVEKHFKNRAVQGRFPSLRKYPVVDLGRPVLVEDDPVWTAGWWSPDNDTEPQPAQRRSRDKGKARHPGERPGAIPAQYNLKPIQLSSGKTGYIVAEGEPGASFRTDGQAVYSYPGTWTSTSSSAS